jgi:antitoxin component YwqK of YwqJK toxin-antitoxin module
MKQIIAICILTLATIGYAQENEPTYKAEGDLVKATYYYEDGSLKTQGYFKDKKLTGEWVRFDKSGNKTQLAYYNKGKKVGKWFVWSKASLKEINYVDNSVASVNVWKHESNVAVNNE